jgi:hypothetical protein
MNCEFNQGSDGIIQLGIASTWGTAVNATKRLIVISESLKFVPNYVAAEAKIGNTLVSRMDILSEKTEGDIEMLLTPDDIAYILYLAMGVEYKVIDGAVSDTYKHYFSLVKSGGSLCLPIFTVEADRLTDIMKYDSLKVNQLTISGEKEGYINFSISCIGRNELDGQTLTAGLQLSNKEYFKFRNLSIYGDKIDSDYAVPSGTGTGVEDETVANVADTLTGAAGLEIDLPVDDSYGVRYVYRYIGAAIDRTGTTLTFKDAPSGNDEIASIILANGKLNVANWMKLTEEYADYETFEISINNNLSGDKFTSYGKGKLSNIQPQGREVTVSLSGYASAETNQMRKQRFKVGRTISVMVDIYTEDIIANDEPCQAGFLMGHCYVTESPLNIDSPDELKVDLSLTAAEPRTIDFVAQAAGTDNDTIATEGASDVLGYGHIVRAKDPDGYQRFYKYVGDAVTAQTSVITFKDSPAAAGEVQSIFTSGVFNNDDWEMAEGFIAYLIDGNDDEWAYPRT